MRRLIAKTGNSSCTSKRVQHLLEQIASRKATDHLPNDVFSSISRAQSSVHIMQLNYRKVGRRIPRLECISSLRLPRVKALTHMPTKGKSAWSSHVYPG
ncbi:hypothetical protein Y032_0013g2189 [Ancylostoma ceylanicum]|uniref:Uncharacterized protein n=1 Tax=Ancylostoma ceylanicum TaxID=53326 RepID=A0A016VB94_9BILA|nr:hypothetical protein Y032_0013g2189 [Ancylostoma ceylanicum]